jgi:hypothetical protein
MSKKTSNRVNRTAPAVATVVPVEKKARGKGVRINHDTLYTLIKANTPVKDIMKQLGIKNKLSIKSAMVDLMVSKNELLKLNDSASSKSSGNRKITKIGLVIPAAKLTDTFKSGDQFTMKMDATTITLTKVQ